MISYATTIFAVLAAMAVAAPAPQPSTPALMDNESIRIGLAHANPDSRALAKRAPAADGAGQLLTGLAFGMTMAMNISIGTPPQNLLIPLELGGYVNKLVLANPGESRRSTGEEEFFYPNQSTTFEQTDQAVTFSPYSNNTGTLAHEVIRLSRLTQTQDIVMAEPEAMKDYLFFFGAAYGAAGFPPGEGFARDLVRGQPNKEIGLFFAPFNQDSPTSTTNGSPFDLNAGELSIGALNSFLYTGDVHYIPLQNSTDWEILLDGVKIDGESIEMGAQADKPPTALARSNAGGIFMEESLANLTMSKIPGSKYITQPVTPNFNQSIYQVPCDTNSTVSLTFGGKDYALPSDQWIRRDPSPRAEGGCYAIIGPIKSERMGRASVILGLPFLSSVYTVLNFANEEATIGFAQLSDAARNVTTERSVGNAGATPTGSIPGHSAVPIEIGSTNSTSAATGVTASWLLVSIAALAALL